MAHPLFEVVEISHFADKGEMGLGFAAYAAISVLAGASPDPVVARAAAARPLVALENLISSEDYPPSAQQSYEEGKTTIRLQISSEGRVTDCIIVEGSGS